MPEDTEDTEDQQSVRQAARLMGSRKSDRKTAAAQVNGRKGGRPPGTPQSEETKAKISAARRKQEGTADSD